MIILIIIILVSPLPLRQGTLLKGYIDIPSSRGPSEKADRSHPPPGGLFLPLPSSSPPLGGGRSSSSIQPIGLYAAVYVGLYIVSCWASGPFQVPS